MSKPGVLIPVAFVVLVLVALPLQAVTELPGEKSLKTALGFDYPKSCEDYETVGKGEPGVWREEPSLPSLRDEPRTVRIGGSTYLAGGLIEKEETTESTDLFEVYDFEAGRYSKLPSLPAKLNHVGLTAYRGDVYMAGGFAGGVEDPVSTDRAWRYRVDERRWERLAPLPSPRAGHGLVVVGDRMYAVGGRLEGGLDPARSLSDVDVYDFARDEWRSAAPMAKARDHLGVAQMDGRIYALGGRAGRTEAFRTFERYDPDADKWEPLSPYPLPVSGIGLEPVGGRLVTAGGEDPGRGRLIGEAWEYDAGADRWRRLPSMSRPKHGYGAVSHRGRFWTFGGAECYGFQVSNSVDSLALPESGR